MDPVGVDDDIFASLLDMVARFTREKLIPNERRVEDEDDIPADIVQAMRDLGLFGLSIPAEFGGLGLSMGQEIQVVMQLCQAALAFRSLIGTNVGIGAQGIVMDGTPEQKQAYLPALATGELIASFALTEPDVGSDAGALRTNARRAGEDFIVNGTKRFITNAPRAGVFTLMARTNPDEKGAAGVTAFLVPADSPGITLGVPDKKMGQRGTKTCDVMFEDVRVPATAIIGGPANLHRGFRTAMKVLDRGRIHVASMAVGSARRMIDEALAYAVERRQFGQPIAEFQLVQAMLADSQTEWLAAKSLVEAAARLQDRDGAAPMEAASAKLFATEAAGRIADRAVQIHGGAGYMADSAVERLYRDIRLLRIYEGTSQIQQLVIARAMVKRQRAGT